MYKEYRMGGSSSPYGFLGPLIILALIFGSLFFLAKGLFWLLSWAAPVLLILTLIIDHKVVTNYFKYVWRMLSENLPFGLLLSAVTIFGYPFVAGYLFFKAYAKRTLKKASEKYQQPQSEFTDYEVVDEDESFLELPPLNKMKENAKTNNTSNKYDDVF